MSLEDVTVYARDLDVGLLLMAKDLLPNHVLVLIKHPELKLSSELWVLFLDLIKPILSYGLQVHI